MKRVGPPDHPSGSAPDLAKFAILYPRGRSVEWSCTACTRCEGRKRATVEACGDRFIEQNADLLGKLAT